MTRSFYLDASAFVKRYTVEPGSAAVSLLVEDLLPARPVRLLTSWLGFLEIVAVLNRHRNDGRLGDRLFQQALLPLTDDVAARALDLVVRHNLNASDALYLRQMLDWQAGCDPQTESLALIAADERLLRAAQAEGITTLDPETADPDTVERLLHN
jgi:predicted nucleic acid-binding protein